MVARASRCVVHAHRRSASAGGVDLFGMVYQPLLSLGWTTSVLPDDQLDRIDRGCSLRRRLVMGSPRRFKAPLDAFVRGFIIQLLNFELIGIGVKCPLPSSRESPDRMVHILQNCCFQRDIVSSAWRAAPAP